MTDTITTAPNIAPTIADLMSMVANLAATVTALKAVPAIPAPATRTVAPRGYEIKPVARKLADIPAVCVIHTIDRNPKANGSQAYRDWRFYRDGMTVSEYVRQQDRGLPAGRARANLLWDSARGFISFTLDSEAFVPYHDASKAEPIARTNTAPKPTQAALDYEASLYSAPAPKPAMAPAPSLYGEHMVGGNAG